MTKLNVLHGYVKVGRLRAPIARIASVPAGNIYIDEPHIRHIFTSHGKQLGLHDRDATLVWIETILSNYNLMVKGSDGALLLIFNSPVATKHLSTAVIKLLPIDVKNSTYEVKSTYLKDNSIVKNKKVLWMKGLE